MNAYEVLKERGFIEQLTHEEEIKALFEKGGVTFYIGIDPTADSLHVGHFHAALRQPPHLPDGRRHRHDRRPLRQSRYA
jgi:hypothetical protein